MKATLTINQLLFELEASSGKDLFQQVAEIQEIFEAETKCGACESEDIRYGYREVDTYKYYELHCRNCDAQFKFGQKKQGGQLFPKRRSEDGGALPNGGWSKYQPNANDESARPSRQQQAAKPPAVNGPNPNAPAEPGKKNGVPSFPTWHDAENSKQYWGAKWLYVDNRLFRLQPATPPAVGNEYVEQQSA